MATDDLKQLLERHRAFWNGGGEKLLRRVTPHVPLQEKGSIPLADDSTATEGQYITPELIEPRRFYSEASKPGTVVNGDFIVGTGPPGLCWTEAILGCRVQVVRGGPWAQPFLNDWTDIEPLKADEAWLEKLVEFVEFLAARAGGSYPIVQPLMRGPIDMMAAALGHERMCIALIEAPRQSDALLERAADFFVCTAARRLQHTPTFEGGYLSSYGIWAPGRVVRTQVDNATLLSPALYRERVLKHDLRVIEAFDYSLIHLHSGCLHIVDELLPLKALKVIQVSLDYPGGPLAADVLPILERILQQKSLIVTGPVTEAELGDLEALEPPGRLCLQVEKLQGDES